MGVGEFLRSIHKTKHTPAEVASELRKYGFNPDDDEVVKIAGASGNRGEVEYLYNVGYFDEYIKSIG